MMRIFEVKSSENYYEDEKNNLKPNTVRFTDDWDEDKWNNFYNATHIKVQKVGDNFNNFIREIKHKAIYKNLAIISWKEEL